MFFGSPAGLTDPVRVTGTYIGHIYRVTVAHNSVTPVGRRRNLGGEVTVWNDSSAGAITGLLA